MSTLLARRQLQQEIKACTNCALHQSVTKPVPFRGPAPAEVCIIGEAPGAQEDTEGRPFVGAAGKLLTTWLQRVEIDPDSVAFMNMVCCRPTTNGSNRAPTVQEIEACTDNFEAQLSFVAPQYILVLGATALGRWWPRLKITQVHGFWWQIEEPVRAWAMATFHPASVLRGTYAHDAEIDMEYFALSASPTFGHHRRLEPGVAQWCVVCNKMPHEWVNGLPFCKAHLGLATTSLAEHHDFAKNPIQKAMF